MSLPPIVSVPHPALRQKLALVSVFDKELAALADIMIQVMRKANGVGLAANQINERQRMFVYAIDEPFELNGHTIAPILPRAIINPTITIIGNHTEVEEEGCLSIPHLYGPVARANRIRLDAQDIDGTPFSKEVSGYEARIIQHETDHLNGVLFLDKVADPTKIRRA